MLTFEFTGLQGKMTQEDVLTSGMVGAQVRMELSGEWEELEKTAVFVAGPVTRTVLMTEETVTIPWEVLASPFRRLLVGICGRNETGKLVIPTILAPGPEIQPGADPSAPTGEEPMVPAVDLIIRTNEVREYALGDGADRMGVIALLGYPEKGKTLVDHTTRIMLRTDGKNLGDAEADDVLEGKTFTSSAGLKLEGTRKALRLAAGTVSGSVVETGLEAVSGMVVFRESCEAEGIVQAVYDGTQLHWVGSMGSENVCATGSGAFVEVEGGTVRFRDYGMAGLTPEEEYRYIAWYQG